MQHTRAQRRPFRDGRRFESDERSTHWASSGIPFPDPRRLCREPSSPWSSVPYRPRRPSPSPRLPSPHGQTLHPTESSPPLEPPSSGLRPSPHVPPGPRACGRARQPASRQAFPDRQDREPAQASACRPWISRIGSTETDQPKRISRCDGLAHDLMVPLNTQRQGALLPAAPAALLPLSPSPWHEHSRHDQSLPHPLPAR